MDFFEDGLAEDLVSAHALPMLSVRVSAGAGWSLDTHRVWLFAAADAGNHVLYELQAGCQPVAIGEASGLVQDGHRVVGDERGDAAALPITMTCTPPQQQRVHPLQP